VNKLSKYLYDTKAKAAITNYYEKNKPARFDKKQQLEKIRAEYMKKQQE